MLSIFGLLTKVKKICVVSSSLIVDQIILYEYENWYEYERKNVVELGVKSDIKYMFELKAEEKLCGAAHKFNWGSYCSLLMWKLICE